MICVTFVELDSLRYLAKFSSPHFSWSTPLKPQFFRRLAKKLCEIFKLTAELVPQVASTHSTHLAQWPFWELTKPTVDWATWDAAPREGKGTFLCVCVCVWIETESVSPFTAWRATTTIWQSSTVCQARVVVVHQLLMSHRRTAWGSEVATCLVRGMSTAEPQLGDVFSCCFLTAAFFARFSFFNWDFCCHCWCCCCCCYWCLCNAFAEVATVFAKCPWGRFVSLNFAVATWL